jgi:2-phosphosulfolactate phosphatase
VTHVELEWGQSGAKVLAERCDALVLVDVLSFTTSVTVAVRRGATVWPHQWGVEGAELLAREIGAVLARGRSTREGPTLSPTSLLDLPQGTRLILPSPNGSGIAHTVGAAGIPIYAACLRNAPSVVAALAGVDRIGLVPAGERWPDGSLRPAYEDVVGSGAVASALGELGAAWSPDAEAAALAFRARRPLGECPSGLELIERGFLSDVQLAEDFDVDEVVPVLRNGRFEAL